MSKINRRSKREGLNLKNLIVPGAVMLAFWTLATILWQSTGEIMALFFFAFFTLPTVSGALQRLLWRLSASVGWCIWDSA